MHYIPSIRLKTYPVHLYTVISGKKPGPKPGLQFFLL